MNRILLTTTVSAFLLGLSGAAFADQPSASAAPPAAAHHATMTKAKKMGTWPNTWKKGEEAAATDALNDLEAHGYSQFSNFQRKDGRFEATVMQNGKTFRVVVDPTSGSVTQEL